MKTTKTKYALIAIVVWLIMLAMFRDIEYQTLVLGTFIYFGLILNGYMRD